MISLLFKISDIQTSLGLIMKTLVAYYTRTGNSKFAAETIDEQGDKNDYQSADVAGSIQVEQGTTVFTKENPSTVLLFPLETGVTLNIQGSTITGNQFTINVNKSTWLGFVTTAGSISPVN